MQALNLTVLGEPYVLRFTGETPDDRGEILCDEDSIVELVEVIADGKSDGRGIPMARGAFTPCGVAAAMAEHGYEVSEADTLPPDLDGEDD